MGFEGRIARLERELGASPGDREANWAIVIDDAETPIDPEELEGFFAAIAPSGELHEAHHQDNGRGDRGPHLSFGGDGWSEAGPEIRDGYLAGNWRRGA
jgi:hypothetical protein